MLWRAPEAEVIPLCEREGIRQIVWSPLAQGVLTGKYRPGEPPPADSRAASESMGGFIGALIDEPCWRRSSAPTVAEQAGLTMAQLALAWVLREPNVASAIVGASRPGAGARQRVGLGHRARRPTARRDRRGPRRRCSALTLGRRATLRRSFLL